MSRATIFILSSALLVLPSAGFGQFSAIANAAAKKAAAKAATDAATRAAANSAAKAAASSAGRSAASSAGRSAAASVPKPAAPSAGTTTYTPHSSTPSATGSTTYTPNSGAVTGGRSAASSTASGSGVVTYTPHTYTPREPVPARPAEPSATSSSGAVTYTPKKGPTEPVFGPVRTQPVQLPHEVAPVVPAGTTGGDGGLHIGVAPPPVSVVYNPNTGVSTYTPRTITQNVPLSGPAGTYGSNATASSNCLVSTPSGVVTLPQNVPAKGPAGTYGPGTTAGVNCLAANNSGQAPSGEKRKVAPEDDRANCIVDAGIEEYTGNHQVRNVCAEPVNFMFCNPDLPAGDASNGTYWSCHNTPTQVSGVGPTYQIGGHFIQPGDVVGLPIAARFHWVGAACASHYPFNTAVITNINPPKQACLAQHNSDN